MAECESVLGCRKGKPMDDLDLDRLIGRRSSFPPWMDKTIDLLVGEIVSLRQRRDAVNALHESETETAVRAAYKSGWDAARRGIYDPPLVRRL